MTHADDSAGAISLLPAVLLLDIYFFNFLKSYLLLFLWFSFYQFCILWKKKYMFQPLVFPICIWQTPDTHVYGRHVTDTSFDLWFIRVTTCCLRTLDYFSSCSLQPPSSGQRLTFLVSIVARVEGYSGQSYVGIVVIIAELWPSIFNNCQNCSKFASKIRDLFP